MFIRSVVVFYIFISSSKAEDMYVVSKSHSGYLDVYKSYSDVTLLHFNVPRDTSFVSFKFEADEMDFSIFGCEPKNVEMYLKRGSPPVINPDGSKFPEGFLQHGRPDLHLLHVKSDKSLKYLNFSTPYPGSYFLAAYQPYIDPKTTGITQDGLKPLCYTFVDVTLSSEKNSGVAVVSQDVEFEVVLEAKKDSIYKFFIPETIDHVLIMITNLHLCSNCTSIRGKVRANNIPEGNHSLVAFELKNEDIFNIEFWTEENTWYYLVLSLDGVANDLQSSLIARLRYFSNKQTTNSTKKVDFYKKSSLKKYRHEKALSSVFVKQYDLVRFSSNENFVYSYDLGVYADEEVIISLNLTSTEFTVLKFTLSDFTDIGGSLHFIVAYKPRRKGRVFEKEPEKHTVVACIRNGAKEIPTWPDKCALNEIQNDSPVVLNKTNTNSSVVIPFPEPGTWYLSLKLFCGTCEKCECSEKCREVFETCRKRCEIECVDSDCNNCSDDCEKEVLTKLECSSCDCDGPCKRNKASCNTSVIFDVSSYSCLDGGCGKNGKCMFFVSEGFSYSACVCTNKYKGWDCSDDSDATSFSMIVLELLLLVLSNAAFLPAVYFAFKRGYRVEPIVYMFTCVFSTFYHACDAGENIISYCIVRLGVLQFSDFFCGLLSIWYTLIAMAYLNDPWPSIWHILGSVLLAFGTMYNKTSLWVFVLPAVIGVVIICLSWYLKYRKMRRLFPSRRYLFRVLPIGLSVVTVGFLTYALLQTQNNYKYLHSLWHIMMATGVIILLPNKDTFLPQSLA